MDRLLNKIVDNIQVTVKNIHVRYEDNYSYEKNPFSLGFTLKALSINTTNGDWEPHYFDRTLSENKDNPIFKKL
jgi:vacuolar protein sorting-associated protein 13A/C